VEHGRVLGIVGHNGAGKTTILKLLSGITRPTQGTVHVDGRISALIELGAGFHPDLTGRENVYLNATILGLSKREIDRRFDSIVEFAELEQFIDTPVKRYSSGMYARLGFAVAAHSEPDLLLVDEVLGVGDGNFQRKCYDFIQRFVKGDRSAIFVSHNLWVIEQLCDTILWLDHGQVRMVGKPHQVLPAYFDHLENAALQNRDGPLEMDAELRLTDVQLRASDGLSRDAFVTGDQVTVEISYEAEMPIPRPHFSLAVLSSGGQALFAANMLVDAAAPPLLHGSGMVRCHFRDVPLMPSAYELWGEVWAEDRAQLLVRWQKLGAFRVVDSGGLALEALGANSSAVRLRTDAPIRVPYKWEFTPAVGHKLPSLSAAD
jgi:ABC-type polysaccharide/polyol phosphate transport system ATPase subunit